VSFCGDRQYGQSCYQNDSWINGSSVAFRSSILTADVSYNIANSSIFAVSNLGVPTYQNITPADYIQSFQWIFGPQYQPGMPSDPVSSVASLIQYLLIDFTPPLVQGFSIPNPELVSDTSTLALLLTIPLLLFQPVFNYVSTSNSSTAGLSPSIELAEMCTLLSIPRWAVIVYIAIVSLIFLWCIGGIVIALFVDESPATSNFDVVDFTAATTANRFEGSLADTFASLPFGKDAEIRKRLEDKSVYVRHLGGRMQSKSDGVEGISEVNKIGFTTDGSKND
jgi:hypothetical protein